MGCKSDFPCGLQWTMQGCVASLSLGGLDFPLHLHWHHRSWEANMGLIICRWGGTLGSFQSLLRHPGNVGEYHCGPTKGENLSSPLGLCLCGWVENTLSSVASDLSTRGYCLMVFRLADVLFSWPMARESRLFRDFLICVHWPLWFAGFFCSKSGI